MPSELPTIASCRHCRTILLRTSSTLVHPLTDEREGILRVLGEFWFDHSRVRFDGRFHRCPSLERMVVEGQRRAVVGDLRTLWLLLPALAVLLVPGPSRGETAEAGASKAAEARPAGARWRAAGSLAPAQTAVDPAPAATKPTEAAADGEPEPRLDGSWLGSELADGRYEVVDTIREGADGVVYLAHDRNLDVHVAVEVPRTAAAEGPGSAQRYVREARGLARLEHPHLAKVTAVGTRGDSLFLVTEHFSGGSLRFRRPVGPDGRPEPAPPESLARWLGEVAGALDYLRSQARPHRAVTPACIVFDGQGRPYVAGLGMSWTPADAPIDRPPERRADQRALAATVYEMFSGRSPRRPRDLKQVCPRVPAALASVVMRGLADDPEERFEDCASFADAALSAATAPEPAAVRPTVARAARPSARPHRAMSAAWPASPASLALGVAGSMVIVIGGAGALRRRRRKTRTPSTPPSPPVARPRFTLAALAKRGRPVLPAAIAPACPVAREPGGVETPALPASPPVDVPRAKVLGHASAGKTLARRLDLEPGPLAPRSGLAKRLLPLSATLTALPFFAPQRLPDTRRRKAS